MGQTHGQKFMPEPLARIDAGDLKPEVIISHRLPLEQAARGYDIFNKEGRSPPQGGVGAGAGPGRMIAGASKKV